MKTSTEDLKKNTLLPPVLPSIIFLTLLPLLASSPSKSYLLKTLVLLQDLFTTQRHWSLPVFNFVIEADLVPSPPVL